MTSDLHDHFGHLSDAQWRDNVLASLDTPTIDGVQMPRFPPADTQMLFTGATLRDTLDEAFRFFLLVKKACGEHGAPLGRDTRLLDFGVGWGRISRMFMKDVASANIHGVDVNPMILSVCRELMPGGHYHPHRNHQPLPFPEGSFDVAVSYSVFSHLAPKSQLAAIRELARCLRPGGLAVVTTLLPDFVDMCRDAVSCPSKAALKSQLVALVRETFPKDVDLQGLGPDQLLRELVRYVRRRKQPVVTAFLPSLLEICRAAVRKPHAEGLKAQLAALVREAHPSDVHLTRLKPDDMLYLASGGGLEGLDAEHYGWAMVPRGYAEKHWSDVFEVVDYVSDPKVLPQAYFVLRRR
jgi:SAM-dependent methyltransferase